MKSFTVKTYTRITDPQAVQNEENKWIAIEAFIGSVKDEEFHLIFENSVPEFTEERDLHDPIIKAFSVQIRETPKDEVKEFLNHTLSNPQELLWSKSDTDTWIATPIFFATQSPIDEAISLPTHWVTKGLGFYIFRTMYKNRPATLKTYFRTTGSAAIFRECKKWREINLLVGTAVAPTGPQFYTMILGNSVPEIALEDIHKTIANAVGLGVTIYDYVNPQEFAWIRWGHNLWSVTRIHFIALGHFSKAIEPTSTRIPIGKGDDFSVFRTTYKSKAVTLKTYTLTTANSMKEIHDYIMKWMRIRLLVGTAVDLEPWDSTSDHEVARFYIMMDNFVPKHSQEALCALIQKGHEKGVLDSADCANPQEYRWTRPTPRFRKWTPTPMNFGSDNSLSHH